MGYNKTDHDRLKLGNSDFLMQTSTINSVTRCKKRTAYAHVEGRPHLLRVLLEIQKVAGTPCCHPRLTIATATHQLGLINESGTHLHFHKLSIAYLWLSRALQWPS